MSTLADVFRELNSLKAAGVVRDYAVGGATAALFYAEPTRTFDVDVFVLLEETTAPLVSLERLYAWARKNGFQEQAEHVLIHGVPVQFLPAHNLLAEQAVATARTLDYEAEPVRVIAPEYLLALALQVGDSRRRERAWQLLESGTVDRRKLADVLGAHGIKMGTEDEV